MTKKKKKQITETVDQVSPGQSSRRGSIVFTQPSKAKQQFKDTCDINRIVGQFVKTGQIPHLANGHPQYGYASSQSFHDAMNIVAEAQSQFAELPSKVRAHFRNDPQEFLACVEDENRQNELVDLGLANARPEAPQEPSETPPIDPVDPAPQDTKKAENRAD